MKQINQDEMKPLSELFASLWALLKQNHHPETESDWIELLMKARFIPADDEESPLYRLGNGMTVNILTYISEINKKE